MITDAGTITETEAHLLQEVKTLRFLIGILLAHTGLDARGIGRAFELAKKQVTELDDEMMELASQKFLATPEGQEAHRQIEEASSARQREAAKEFWREDCLEARRILRDPTAKG